jgi:radical SAM superfamily enzyme YgiQ (UPF0313 family)
MSVLLIQPAIVYPEEPIAGRHQTVRQKEAYIEIGLLSVASFLESKGVEVSILNMADNKSSLNDLSDVISRMQPQLAAIPCMSGYSYPSLRKYSELIKEISPSTYVITGGQHSGPLGQTVLEEIPSVDCVVRYEGEVLTWQILSSLANQTADLKHISGIVFRYKSKIISTEGAGPQIDLDNLPFLNYRLFPNFVKYVPRLEESRGCPFDCWFCSNASVFTRKVRYKTVDRLINELCAIHKQYGEPECVSFYLISKNYGLDEDITLEFARRVTQLPFQAEWRTQSTIDVFNPNILPILSAAGLRMIDLGLESASPQMLLLMNKTSCNPEAYLKKAEDIIEKAINCPNTKVKFNLIFHPGETADTLAETLEFLFRWRTKIAGVTASPIMIDPGAPLWSKIKFFEDNYGTRLIKNAFWDSIHIYPVHPSSDLSFEQVNVISTLVSKMFQTKDDYYETRRFGGIQRGIDIQNFDKEMEDIPRPLRPYTETKRV